MAIVSTIDSSTVFGNKRVVFGHYTASSDTTGSMYVGVIPDFVVAQSHLAYTVPTTIVTSCLTVTVLLNTSDTGGTWMAIGTN